MHRISVHYAHPRDPEDFDARYRAEHVPLVHELPGLAGFTTSHVQPLGGSADIYLIAELDFADAESMQTALGSPQMAAAGEHAASLGAPMTMLSGEVVTH